MHWNSNELGFNQKVKMLKLSEVRNIIEVSGLNAQFRLGCEDKWNDFVKHEYNVPSFYLENEVDYQIAVFNYLSKSSTDISLILYHDNSPCGVWPSAFDICDKEPLKSINNQYGGIILPPLFTNNFPKKSERKVIKSCMEFLNKLLINKELLSLFLIPILLIPAICVIGYFLK